MALVTRGTWLPKAAAAALVIATAGWIGMPSAQAGLTNVQFSINSTTSTLRLAGTVRGDFFGTGFVSDIALTGQGSGNPLPGSVTKYTGSVNADIGFDSATTTATTIKLTNSSLEALIGGNWAPGGWNPTAESPLGDPGNTDGNFTTATEAANYGLRVSTFVNTGVRNLVLDSRSLATNVLSGSNFTNGFGLEFLTGYNDLDAEALGTIDRQILRDELDTFEIAGPGVVQPSGMAYPGGIVWRQVVGQNPNGTPIFGALANEFTDDVGDIADDIANGGTEPVRLYTEAGAEIPQLFQNASANASKLIVTPTGGGNVNLALTLDVNATGAFFLGDFLVRLQFIGQINATGTALFAEPPPELVGDANGDCSVGAADYAIWAAQFGQTGASLSADFDGNGSVGAGDYALWAANFGKTCDPGAAGAAVPEPSTWALGLLGSLALGLVARRRANG